MPPGFRNVPFLPFDRGKPGFDATVSSSTVLHNELAN
jgi:hypothetical protein